MAQDFMAFAKQWIFQNISAPLNELVLFTVDGDSMECTHSQIKDGALILADKSINEFKNDGVYVVSINNRNYAVDGRKYILSLTLSLIFL